MPHVRTTGGVGPATPRIRCQGCAKVVPLPDWVDDGWLLGEGELLYLCPECWPASLDPLPDAGSAP